MTKLTDERLRALSDPMSPISHAEVLSLLAEVRSRRARENSATPDPDRRAVERFAAILANIRNDAIEERAAEILYLLRSDAQHLLADLNPHGVWAKTLRNMESLRSLSSRGETKGDKP